MQLLDPQQRKNQIKEVLDLGSFTKEQGVKLLGDEETLMKFYREGWVYKNVKDIYKATDRLKEVYNTLSEGRFERMVKETIDFDDQKGYSRYMDIQPELQNLSYLALAINGEAGEIADDTKKLIREGYSEDRMANLRKELVDVSIYLAKMIDTMDIDFDAEWEAKHEELRNRQLNLKQN